ncbi:MAG: STAS domain-containing protein [Bryobacteraceae bacterium]
MTRARLVIRSSGGVTVIDAFGKLSAREGFHSLHDQVSELSANGCHRILLNLAGIPSVDCADIGELAACHAAVVLDGGELKLLLTSAHVAGLLQATRLDVLIETHVSEGLAIRSFSASGNLPNGLAAQWQAGSECYIG